MKAIVTAILAAVLAASAQTGEAARQLNAARNAELVDGDLNAAIKQYAAIVSKFVKTDRAATAMALVQMAECYQKMGNAESRKIFEQVVRDYADQKEAVTLARVRLRAPNSGSADSSTVSRQRWMMQRGQQVFGIISKDGRYLPYTDWADKADLFLHDFTTGSDRRLTNEGDGGNLFAATAVLSKNGEQLAYCWYSRDHWELRVMSLRGTDVPKSKLLYSNPDIEGLAIDDWSPDGESLAVHLQRKDRTGQIGLVSMQDGALHVIKSIDWRGPTRILFSPDGKYLAFDLPANDSTDQRDVYLLAVDGSRQTVPIAHPAQDVIVGWTPDGLRLLFASDRTGSMGLWGVPIANGSAQGVAELIQPKLAGDAVGVTVSGAIYSLVSSPRFHGGITSDIHLGAFDFGTGRVLTPPAVFAQEFMGANGNPDWSSDGKSLAYMSRPRKDGLVIIIRSLETGRVIRQFEPKLSVYVGAWVRWSPDGRFFATQGTDAKGREGIYSINAESGEAAPVVVQAEYAYFAPAWSPDGGKLYYGRIVRNGGAQAEVSLVARDLTSGTERVIIQGPRAQLNLQQWSLSPDGRHAVAIRRNPVSGSSSPILIPISGGEPRDLMNGSFFMWAPDSQSVYLRSPQELSRVPLDNAERRKVDWSPDPDIRAVRVSPDGRHIALMATTPPKPDEVWVLENFLPKAPRK